MYRFLLSVDEDQKNVFEYFINITREKNLISGRYKLASLWFTYLVLTLLLIIVRKLFIAGTLIFVIRVSFIIYVGNIFRHHAIHISFIRSSI